MIHWTIGEWMTALFLAAWILILVAAAVGHVRQSRRYYSDSHDALSALAGLHAGVHVPDAAPADSVRPRALRPPFIDWATVDLERPWSSS